jgi:type IV pilus secretin PilQ/predicted competence protein
MTGMKIRFAGIRNLASIKGKCISSGALLFILAFAVPQVKPNSAGLSQPQSNAAAPSKDSKSGSVAKTGTVSKTAESLGAITDVSIAPDNDKLIVTVTTNRQLTPQEFVMENPARLVIDFPNTRNKVKFTQLPVNSTAVKKIRVQQFQDVPSPISRVVFDLNEAHGKHEITSELSSVRVIFNKDNSKPSISTQLPIAPARPKTADAPAVEPVKTAAVIVKPKSVEPPAKSAGTAAAPPPSQPDKIQQKTEPPKTTSTVNSAKPDAAQTPVAVAVKAPAVQQASMAIQTVELPKAADFNTPKPLSPEPAEKKTVTVPVQIAAVAQTPSPSPKMTLAPSTRFSGQPLTLDLIDVPLVDFFRLMSEEGGINIFPDPDVKGKITVKGVKIPWDQVFEMALVSNGLDKQVEGNLVRITRKSTLQDEAKQRESLKKATLLAADVETRIKRLNYAKANEISKILSDQKTVRGTVVIDERTNALILTDLPNTLDKMMQLIETLDTAQPQVEIEARIVSATRDFARSIGIQFGFVDGNLQRVSVGGPNTFGTIGGTRPSATPSTTYAAGNPQTGRGATSSSASESAATSTGTSGSSSGNYNVNLPASKPFGGMGISIGNIFDTFLLDAAITAGETKGLAKLISQPKVTAQNNSTAVITQGLRFPVPVEANHTITVQFHNAALTLTVTPQITYEGNILLDLKVENNTPDFGKQVGNVPSIRTSESTTKVLVTDGGTTVIGGILIDDEANSEDKVPGLGSLPIIGNLFRRTSVSRSTQEVLFFVTPRILNK